MTDRKPRDEPDTQSELALLEYVVEHLERLPPEERARYIERTHSYLWDRYVMQPRRDARSGKGAT